MICEKCGQPLPDDAKFCAYCGVTTEAPSQPEPAVQAPQMDAVPQPVPSAAMSEKEALQRKGLGGTKWLLFSAYILYPFYMILTFTQVVLLVVNLFTVKSEHLLSTWIGLLIYIPVGILLIRTYRDFFSLSHTIYKKMIFFSLFIPLQVGLISGFGSVYYAGDVMTFLIATGVCLLAFGLPNIIYFRKKKFTLETMYLHPEIAESLSSKCFSKDRVSILLCGAAIVLILLYRLISFLPRPDETTIALTMVSINYTYYLLSLSAILLGWVRTMASSKTEKRLLLISFCICSFALLPAVFSMSYNSWLLYNSSSDATYLVEDINRTLISIDYISFIWTFFLLGIMFLYKHNTSVRVLAIINLALRLPAIFSSIVFFIGRQYDRNALDLLVSINDSFWGTIENIVGYLSLLCLIALFAIILLQSVRRLRAKPA